MKETFVEHEFSTASAIMIVKINDILTEYRDQDFRLSLRQLYYQLVSRSCIENSQRSYKNVGNLVSTARQAGLIDWEMIEDRGRETVVPVHWDSPADIVKAAADSFSTDKWEDQPYHIEVMVEKDALSGVLEPVCRRLDIGITANKGYSSSSTMYEIGKRLQAEMVDKKEVVLLYLGDHDPSGIDMTRDVAERLQMYSGGDFEMQRLALNMDQVQRWNPPPNPAKETDARFKTYLVQFGQMSWELDAIEPAQLARLIEVSVESFRDDNLWKAALAREKDMREKLLKFADNYNQ